ncbi:MAG: monovalent cation/H(+) antiporter subunit G [Hyphomicrobiaceae bacterium]|nr:monovalent cation/H(+) antiporter subunit G [Hyphomicrobiaceae bacterium]
MSEPISLPILELIAGVLIVIGAIFSLLASLGILRFPDVYSRMHAASKAGTLGSGLMLLAIAVLAVDLAVVTRAMAGAVFFLLTAPVSSHLLARAAYFVGYEPWEGTVRDDLQDRYSGEGEGIRCESTPPVAKITSL